MTIPRILAETIGIMLSGHIIFYDFSEHNGEDLADAYKIHAFECISGYYGYHKTH